MNSKQIVSSPSKFFTTPQDLVNYKGLDYVQKNKALENWKNSLTQVLECEQEGMTFRNKKVEISDIDTAIKSINRGRK